MDQNPLLLSEFDARYPTKPLARSVDSLPNRNEEREGGTVAAQQVHDDKQRRHKIMTKTYQLKGRYLRHGLTIRYCTYTKETEKRKTSNPGSSHPGAERGGCLGRRVGIHHHTVSPKMSLFP